MHVQEVRLLNWLRYRGKHTIALNPSVYAVVARHESDEGRSNWLGKTSLLNAVRFALFGKHPSPTEDAWISRGEPKGGVGLAEGGVGLLLSDGTMVERRRERGKATRLAVQLPDGTKSFGDEAQAAIEERIGLTDADFIATCFFPQKQIGRFVVAQPAERMKIIGGWLQLEPLQRAEKAVRAKLNWYIEEEVKQEATIKAHKEMVAKLLSPFFDEVGDPTPKEVDVEMADVIATLQGKKAEAKVEADRFKGEIDRRKEWKRTVEDAGRYDAIVREMAGIKAVDPGPVEAELKLIDEDMAVKRMAMRSASEHRNQMLQLACGKFDGRCPVDGHGCPDAATMNHAREENRARATLAETELTNRTAEFRQAGGYKNKALAAYVEVTDAAARRQSLLDQAKQYEQAAKTVARQAPPPEDDAEARAEAAWMAYQKTEADSREAIRVLALVRKEFDAINIASDHLVDIRHSIVLRQQAVAILGKNGAQKRIAEGALSAIANMANESLVDAGIDLRVQISWTREGQGLAEECSACGAGFPKGRSIKTCERCGASRGPKTVERIEVDLSDVSGAAEDIAGVVIQLATGAWLRSRRGSAWSAAFIDEPFGSLDTSNRHALATHLATLLRGRYGFEQALVVAHDRSSMDALPGRIVITAGANGSQPVVA